MTRHPRYQYEYISTSIIMRVVVTLVVIVLNLLIVTNGIQQYASALAKSMLFYKVWNFAYLIVHLTKRSFQWGKLKYFSQPSWKSRTQMIFSFEGSKIWQIRTWKWNILATRLSFAWPGRLRSLICFNFLVWDWSIVIIPVHWFEETDKSIIYQPSREIMERIWQVLYLPKRDIFIVDHIPKRPTYLLEDLYGMWCHMKII